jgi:hypothetical protein
MKTNPVGTADCAQVAEKKVGVVAICEDKYTFKIFLWSTRSTATARRHCHSHLLRRRLLHKQDQENQRRGKEGKVSILKPASSTALAQD